MEREPRVVRVLAVLPALVAAAGKVVDRVLDARRGKLEAVLREKWEYIYGSGYLALRFETPRVFCLPLPSSSLAKQ